LRILLVKEGDRVDARIGEKKKRDQRKIYRKCRFRGAAAEKKEGRIPVVPERKKRKPFLALFTELRREPFRLSKRREREADLLARIKEKAAALS